MTCGPVSGSESGSAMTVSIDEGGNKLDSYTYTPNIDGYLTDN